MSVVLRSVTRLNPGHDDQFGYSGITGEDTPDRPPSAPVPAAPGPPAPPMSSGQGLELMDMGSNQPNNVSVVPDDTYTVAQAVNALGFGKFQIRLSLVTGLCWMADSMEMMILSILSPALHCSWAVSSYSQALLTTVVFLGMMLSSTFWGSFSDRYGRRKGLVVSCILLCYYGVLSALAPTYFWVVFLRGLVGFAVGCMPQGVTLYAEFLPTKHRGKCVVLLETFWAFGACLEVLLALLVMPRLGWRWLLGLSAVPMTIFLLVSPWLPESVRYLSWAGRRQEAAAVLRRIAEENGKPMLLGRLVVEDNDVSATLQHRGRIRDLLVPRLRMTSLLLWLVWVTCAFCYYGLVLLSTELLGAGQSGCISLGPTQGPECSASCRPLGTLDYADLLWTTLAEFPGIFVTVGIIERLGRKRTMALEFLLFSTTMSFLFFCVSNRILLTAVLFLARSIVTGVFQAAYVYTPEVYPTALRSVGVGTCNTMARLGAMVTPYVAQVVLRTSVPLAAAIYAGAALVAAVAVVLLPVETRGKELPDQLPQGS